jgi:glycogen debranching enzyme
VVTIASNPGHLLWLGAATAERAPAVVAALMGPSMFSGWGIRTLSAENQAFNPLGYHTGSVWPHDNALALAGFRRYGFDADARRLGAALLDLAVHLPDYQVPELFSGDARDLRPVPTPFPVSSRPQAWAAAAIPFVLTSLLGIRPLDHDRISVTAPVLPENLEWVRLRNLWRGQGSVDLLFSQRNGHVFVEVEAMRGGAEVVLSHAYPGPLTS